jgi:hypothetical protein
MLVKSGYGEQPLFKIVSRTVYLPVSLLIMLAKEGCLVQHLWNEVSEEWEYVVHYV